jgi:hypothetical protein
VHLRRPLNFFIVVSIYWKHASYRSSLDLSSFGKTSNRSAAKLISFLFGPTCMLFNLSIALQLLHDLSKVAAHTPLSGACETWVPLGPHRQVGPAYQKTRRPVRGPNRPSWRPTRPLEDLPEHSPDDLIHHDLKTRCTEQDLVDYDQSRSTGYGKMCNVDLGLLVVTDQESGNRPHPPANIRRMRRPIVQRNQSNPRAIYTNNWTQGITLRRPEPV